MPRAYQPEFRHRAFRMLGDARQNHETEFKAIRHVASKLGMSPETLGKWQRCAEIDASDSPCMTREEHAEAKRPKHDSAELRRANGILRAASAFCRGTRSSRSQVHLRSACPDRLWVHHCACISRCHKQPQIRSCDSR